jgi:microcystin degradation protein MlrC
LSAVTRGAPEEARLLLNRLADYAWQAREAGNVIEADFESLWPEIRRALQEPATGPVVIAEPSDNIGGGAPGDGTGLLRAFLRHDISSAAVVLNDPSAVARLAQLSSGTRCRLPLGGASGIEGALSLELDVELVSTSDGKFTLEDAHSHLASMAGLHIEMGPCATVRHHTASGVVWILLTSRKTPPFDLGQLRSQGIVPEEMALIGVKAAVAHRRAYDPIARASFAASTPGACASDLKTLPFRNVRRPIFPLDEM